MAQSAEVSNQLEKSDSVHLVDSDDVGLSEAVQTTELEENPEIKLNEKEIDLIVRALEDAINNQEKLISSDPSNELVSNIKIHMEALTNLKSKLENKENGPYEKIFVKGTVISDKKEIDLIVHALEDAINNQEKLISSDPSNELVSNIKIRMEALTNLKNKLEGNGYRQ